MAITDLTNTTGIFNDIISEPPYSETNSTGGGVYIDFYYIDSKGFLVNCSTMGVSLQYQIMEYEDLNANEPSVYSFKTNIGEDSVYKTITITGGTEATNPDFIAGLQENATQVIEELPSSKETYFSIMSELAQTIAEKTGVELPLTIEEMIEALGETSSINITLKAADGGLNHNSIVKVKFGSAPIDDSDGDYYCLYGDRAIVSHDANLGTSAPLTVASEAYIWYHTMYEKEDDLAGYKLNGGSLITPGYGYSNATKIELKEGDILTLISTGLD